MGSIEEYRKEINEIDEKMAVLFERRMQVCRSIGEYKKENALPIRDVSREDNLTAMGLNMIKDPDIAPYYASFIKNNIDLSCRLQSRIINGMKVGYSGVPGAYAYIAAKRMFPGSELISLPNFENAYRSCEAGEIDCAVLPIENSYAGDVGTVMDLAFSGSLFVNRTASLNIEHSLLSLDGASLSGIRTVVSHPQAVSQCDEYIRSHGYEVREYSNTARAAEYVKEMGDPHIAAIASEETAGIFGLKILESHINTNRNNSTKFCVFSRSRSMPSPSAPNDEYEFILVFTVPNEAGSLAMILDIIGAHGFNMRTLRSRPMKSLAWNYYFYIEAEGNINSENGQDMLREMSVLCDKLKLVGTYEGKVTL
mgnify:CR=1 FL=1